MTAGGYTFGPCDQIGQRGIAMTCRVMPDRIPTEEVERIANRNDCLAAVTALRALAAERDALEEALRKATWDLANFTFRGKDTSLGEEAERQYRAALGEEEK